MENHKVVAPSYGSSRIEGLIDNAKKELHNVLSTNVADLTIHNATQIGNRVNLALHVLNGEVRQDTITLSLSNDDK